MTADQLKTDIENELDAGRRSKSEFEPSEELAWWAYGEPGATHKQYELWLDEAGYRGPVFEANLESLSELCLCTELIPHLKELSRQRNELDYDLRLLVGIMEKIKSNVN